MFETALLFLPLLVIFAINVATLNPPKKVRIKIDKKKGE